MLLALALTACEPGVFGPFERGARAIFFAWDMWDTEAVRPFENPLPPTPEGVVPVTGKVTFADAAAEVAAMDEETRTAHAKVAYRRYCHHCHGANGDGRIIVGESFNPPVPDLTTKKVRDMSDEELYDQLVHGTEIMIPLDTTMSPTEMMLAITHVRSLADSPSTPYFEPKSTEPITD
jgi:mono/diheme cytochrome c family protein